MAISLRIGSYNLLKAEGAEPVLILDDIFAELDTARRQQLTSVTQMAEQTFITCLLYTSPSPRDRQKSRMPSSA